MSLTIQNINVIVSCVLSHQLKHAVEISNNNIYEDDRFIPLTMWVDCEIICWLITFKSYVVLNIDPE